MTARTAAAAIVVAGIAALPAAFARPLVDGFEPVKLAVLLTVVLGVAVVDPRRVDPRCVPSKRVPLSAAIVLAWLAAAAVATALSMSPATSLVGADDSHGGLVTAFATAALFFTARGLGATAGGRAVLLAAAVAGTAVATGYGATQALDADPLPWKRVADYSGWSRPFGTLGHPNHLGGLLAMILPLQVWVARTACGRRRWIAGGVASAGGCLSAAVLGATLSRAAWIATIAGLVVAVGLDVSRPGRRPRVPPVVTRGRRHALRSTAVLMTVAIGGLLLATAATRATLRDALAKRAGSVADLGPRPFIWQAAMSAFRESPVVGSGLDTFALVFQRHRPPLYWTREYDATPTKAHNDVLHTLATQGLVGGIAWCLVVGGGLGLGIATVRRTTGRERGLAAALLGGWIAFLVHVQASFTVVALTTVLVAWAAVLAGLRSAPGREGAADPRRGPLPGGPWGPTLAALGALAVGLASSEPGLGSRLAVFGFVAVVASSQAWAVYATASELATPSPAVSRSVPCYAPPSGPVARAAALAWAAVCIGAWVFLVYRPLAASAAAHRAQSAPTSEEKFALLEEAHRFDPLRVTWLRWLGLALSGTGTEPSRGLERLEIGREILLQAVRLVPADAYGWASLVGPETRLAAAGRLDREQPFRSLDEALRRDPANVTFRTAGANAALQLGDLPRARRYASEAAALLPGFAPARAQLAHVAAREGRLDDGIRLLHEALSSEWYGQVEARHVAQANLASLLVRARRFAEAEAVARALVAEAPGFAPGHAQLVRAREGLRTLRASPPPSRAEEGAARETRSK